MQAWFSRIFPEQSYARLYALSNVGSLLGLLAYPDFDRAFVDIVPARLGMVWRICGLCIGRWLLELSRP